MLSTLTNPTPGMLSSLTPFPLIPEDSVVFLAAEDLKLILQLDSVPVYEKQLSTYNTLPVLFNHASSFPYFY